jgi:ribosome-binding factor A
MQPSRRPQRVALEIQHEISNMVTRGLKDRRIGLVTITGVEMSKDLRHARVFFSAMGSEKQRTDCGIALNHATGWIRHELGQRIRMKFLPEIAFCEDTSIAYGEKIDQLLEKIREE